MTMTIAEVFHKAASHLLRQNAQSLRPGVGCAYRGSGGRMCAVGVLLSEEHYDPSLEGKAADHERVRAALTLSGVPADNVCTSMMRELQEVHDHSAVVWWPVRLRFIAKKYKIEWNGDA